MKDIVRVIGKVSVRESVMSKVPLPGVAVSSSVRLKDIVMSWVIVEVLLWADPFLGRMAPTGSSSSSISSRVPMLAARAVVSIGRCLLGVGSGAGRQRTQVFRLRHTALQWRQGEMMVHSHFARFVMMTMMMHGTASATVKSAPDTRCVSPCGSHLYQARVHAAAKEHVVDATNMNLPRLRRC